MYGVTLLPTSSVMYFGGAAAAFAAIFDARRSGVAPRLPTNPGMYEAVRCVNMSKQSRRVTLSTRMENPENCVGERSRSEVPSRRLRQRTTLQRTLLRGPR